MPRGVPRRLRERGPDRGDPLPRRLAPIDAATQHLDRCEKLVERDVGELEHLDPDGLHLRAEIALLRARDGDDEVRRERHHRLQARIEEAPDPWELRHPRLLARGTVVDPHEPLPPSERQQDRRERRIQRHDAPSRALRRADGCEGETQDSRHRQLASAHGMQWVAATSPARCETRKAAKRPRSEAKPSGVNRAGPPMGLEPRRALSPTGLQPPPYSNRAFVFPSNATWGRRRSRLASPIPFTSRRSSSDLRPPRCLRSSTMARARASPTPGRSWSSSTLAVFTFTTPWSLRGSAAPATATPRATASAGTTARTTRIESCMFLALSRDHSGENGSRR